MALKHLLFLVCSPLLWCMPAYSEAEGSVKVGSILPLTGPLSVQGIPFRNAMVLAKEELDKEGRISLYFEDDAFLPRKTVTAAHKLIGQDSVDALVVFGTNQGLAVGDIAERKKIPFLSINVNRAVVENRPHAFLVMPSLEVLTAQNIEEAKRRGYKRVATVSSMQDSCLLQKEIFESSGVAEIVASQEFDPSEREFREIVTRITRSHPDAIFMSTIAPQGGLLAKRLRQLGYKGEIFGGIQIAYLSELQASDGALENAWVVSADDRHAQQYYDRYRQRFESEPTDLSMYAYDSVKLVIEGTRTKDLSRFLHTVKDFEGMAGVYSADGKNGFTFKVAVKQFTRDGYKYLNP